MNASPSTLKTGDMLATRGRGFVSSLIAGWTRLVTFGRSRFSPSHTAVLVAEPGRRAMVYHATSSCSLPDATDGVYRSGVQAQYMDDFLRAYDGEVWHVPLCEALPDEASAVAYWFGRHDEQREYDTIGALGSAMPWRNHDYADDWQTIDAPAKRDQPVKDTRTGRALYCTAYWMYGLRCGGVFPPPNWNPREWHPKGALSLPIVDYSRRRRLK